MELPEGLVGRDLTRRQALRYLGVLGAGAAASGPVSAWASSSRPLRLALRAAQSKAAGSDLGAIEHIVFLMMENRSYDHYFGAYPRGRGFDDHPRHSLGAFAQDFPGGSGLVPAGKLLPFHLSAAAGRQCTADLTHQWGPMHLCWNHGAMDSWVKVHTSSRYEGAAGALTMGYYERKDLPFYYALADHFTLCDNYHCSILGPTHPNRLMSISGTIDPAGTRGGPVTDTNITPDVLWNCTWSTMPEVLEDAGVSWKVYNPSNLGLAGTKYASLASHLSWNPALYDPVVNPELMAVSDSILPYFGAFRNPLSPLYQKAFKQTFPGAFAADVASGSLPSVSWIVPAIGFDEHPSAAPANGMYFTSLVLDALTSNPAVWSKTALFVMYDENDGFFDHVAPPTPPPGTPGEYLTANPPILGDPVPGTLGIKGPLGLGIRVPMLVVSPFSRGGHIASEVFDHTSQLKLIAERFGVEVPNVSAWRRATVGDLTSTLFRSKHNATVPRLPSTSPYTPVGGPCAELTQDTEGVGGGVGPTIPRVQHMPTQGRHHHHHRHRRKHRHRH